jgi:hypothetical protein
VSKTVLWVVIGAAAFVVVLLAVLTPTVIVDDNDDYARSVRVMAPVAPAPEPFPFRQGRLPDLGRCFQQHGFGGPGRTPSSPDKLRRALRDCVAPFGG